MKQLVITFILYFIAIFSIAYKAYKSTSSHSEYILGGRSLGGIVTALGVGASDMGGWLMIGLPGAVYLLGISQIIIPIGLVIGAYINWRFVARRIRVYTQVAKDSLTISSYLENRFNNVNLRLISAVIILIFFTLYVSSGFVSGALLFSSIFHINYHTALLLGVILVVSYTSLGGFLAVNWVDVFQGILMLIALVYLPIMVLFKLGGISHVSATLNSINPNLLHPVHNLTIISVVSYLAWGLGYFGQPHILVRFMASKNDDTIKKGRQICIPWMILSLLGAVAVGLVGRAYFVGNSLSDPEKVFLVLSNDLFNPWIEGILVSAVLSCILSTVSAQLILSSSIIAEDFYHRLLGRKSSDRFLVILDRATVSAVALIAVYLAWFSSSSVLSLVSHAWAGLGASFGPVILLSVLWPRFTANGAAAAMSTGAVVVLTWLFFQNYLSSYNIFNLYEMIPGFFASLAAGIITSYFDDQPNNDIKKIITAAEQQLGY